MNQIFKKILNHQTETILGAGLITSVFALLSSVLGFIRNALLASRFGASSALDIYYASFRLPDFIYNVFIIGTISAAFIPLLNDYLVENKEKAWQFSSLILSLISFLLIIIGLIVIIFAYPLLKKILIGFSEENLKMTVFLTRLLMIQPLLLGISAVFSSILRSFRLFFISALTPVVYNLGIIFGILFLAPKFGLKGLIFGVIFGAVAHVLIQVPSLLNLGYRFKRFKISTFVFSIKKLFAVMSSRTLSIIISQIFLLGVTSIATLLKEGTITIFSFVDNILPYTIFALPLADAAFPYLSRLESEKKKDEFILNYEKTLLLILFFIIPLSFWMIVFREPIVRLLLGYGKFNWQATLNTMKVLEIMSLAMIFQSLNYYLLKVFFAKKDAKRPFFASLFSYGTGFLICFYLGLKLKASGLALGILFTYIIYSLLLFLFLRKHLQIPPENKKEFLKSLIKILTASILSSLIGFLSLNFLEKIYPFSKVKNLVFSSIISFVFTLLIFLIVCKILEIKEVKDILGYFKKRFVNKNDQHS